MRMSDGLIIFMVEIVEKCRFSSWQILEYDETSRLRLDWLGKKGGASRYSTVGCPQYIHTSYVQVRSTSIVHPKVYRGTVVP